MMLMPPLPAGVAMAAMVEKSSIKKFRQPERRHHAYFF
jgi:hypothetical protein